MINQGFACKGCSKAICKTCRGSSNNAVWYGCGVGAQAAPAVPVQMNQTVMNFYLNYTSRTKDGQLIVHSLPKEWVELFKAAKVRPKELKNPDTVVFLLQLMDEQLAKMDHDGGGVHEEAGEPSKFVLKESSEEAAETTAPSSELTLDVVQSLPVLFRVKAYTAYQKSNPDDISIKEGTGSAVFL